MKRDFLPDWTMDGRLEDIFIEKLEARVALLERKTTSVFPNSPISLSGLEEGVERFASSFGQIISALDAVKQEVSPATFGKIEELAKAAFLAGMMTASFGELSFDNKLWKRKKSQKLAPGNLRNQHFVEIIREIMEGMENPTPAMVKRRLKVKYRNSAGDTYIEENDENTGEHYLNCKCIRCGGKGRLSFRSVDRIVNCIKAEFNKTPQ
ncbi:hypothetical protein [Desulfurivibrio sp. C05AmB]|uniref:hypothetical protein n=1 Tax=Desulfurivibrio sp. C05AmB TaxID=3374371 RepID=UPI00376F1EAC